MTYKDSYDAHISYKSNIRSVSRIKEKAFIKSFFLLLFTPICISNSFAQSSTVTKPVIKQDLKKVTPVQPKTTATPKPKVSSTVDINEIYAPAKKKDKKPVPPKVSPSVKPAEVKVEASKPPVAVATPTPVPTTISTKNPEDKMADEVDISAYSYIDNLEASTEFFNLIINSSCSKAPENCNSNDLLEKISKQIVTEIKQKYPLGGRLVSEEQAKFLLMNSVTLKDKLGQNNLSKMSKIKEDLKSINESVFKEKREDIIKKVMANPTQPTPSAVVTVQKTPEPVAIPSANVQTQRGKIAFVSERDGNPEIYVMNPDGSNQTRITNNDVYDQMPAWSPDGTKIAFVSEREGNPEIYVMNADGSNPIRLTTNSAYDYSPGWSPDGKKIIFVSNRENVQMTNSPVAKLGFKIFVMNSDGTEQKQLFENSVGDESPSWSPDGSRIAFVSKRDGNPEIYVCNFDGTNVVRLTNSPTFDMMPAWSPDSKMIAFRSDRDGNPEIYTMSSDGSNQTRTTRNLSSDEYPTWSPDGLKVLFVSRRDNIKDESGDFVNEIYMMNADSSNISRLTNNSADDYQPSWSTLP